MADSKDDFSDKATNMELLEKAKNEFNREKRLIIKNLPSATSEKDIHAFMGFNGEFPVESVAMVKNLNQAIVTLKDPSLVDDAISKLDNTKLDTLTVSVAVYRSEKILCVAHLPLTMTEYKFREMVVQHGTVDTCFLMRSEDTGCSKGYGFVEYNEPIERVGQIKCAMDWLELDGQIVHCDAIVDSSQSGIDFQDLHSKCLLINNLPDDYSDSITLRELFSQLVKPIYCQIVTKEGCSLGFGIIEYDDASDAEKAFNKFNGYEIHGKNMNIQYCIPGKSAVHMFNRIMYQYGDKVNVNKSSLLPDPVYPNPAFLKHVFFKTHVVKHPRLLVQFTENLLYLQEGYVKRLENRTNAKPGLLGPPPTIPMSPLMDINLQLGLLSVIVLDLREKGKYNGEVPEPLGKVKIPSEEEFQEKPQPVSLLGDPMTAQANIILKNILMPEEGREQRPSPTDETTPRLLGKPVSDLSMVYLCSFGRLMSMLTEKSMNMGILGNAPNNSSNAPVKPLMEGLMQAGKVAQKLLNTMNMGQQNNMSNMMNQKQTGLLGNPQNMNNNNNNNTGNAASNFMNTIQQMAMQKLGQNQNSVGRNKQELPSLFGNNSNMGNNSNNNNNSGDGLLGNYQGPAMPGRMQGSGISPPGSGMSAGSGLGAGTGSLGGGPKPLMSLNFNNKGDGLIPTPPILEDDGSCGFSGNHSNYDDSGYQGGFDDAEYNEAYGDNQYNGGKGTCYQGRQMNSNKSAMGRGSGIRSLMDPDFDVSSNSEQRYDGAYFSGINGRQKAGMGATSMGQQNMGQPNIGPSNMGQSNVNRMGDNGGNKYNNMAQQAAFYAAGAAAAYKHQYEEWMQSSGYNNNQSGGGYGASNNQSAQTAGYGGSNNQSTGYGTSNTGFNNQQMGSFNNQGQSSMKNTQMSNSNMNQQQQQFNFSQNSNQQQQQFNFSQNTQKSGGYSRDGKSSFGTIGQRPPSLMGPPNSTSLNWQSGATGLTTPQGQKRAFSHVLPSPEPSPEGDYIGQHSQGLGGHYADTYTKRQKLSGRF